MYGNQRKCRKSIGARERKKPMKKILLIVIPILILIVSCAIILGLVLAHKRSGYKSSAGKKEAPQVEYITLTYGGGISGHYDLEERVYQNSSGYHLYVRYQDEENTFDLTETEYRICTDVTPEYFTELEESKAQSGSDLIYTSITVKFKGEAERTLPWKAYQVTPLGPMKYIINVKKHSQENMSHYDFSKRLGEFLLEHENYLTVVSYKYRDPDSKQFETKNVRFLKHAEIPVELQKSQEYSSLARFCSKMELLKSNKDDFTRFEYDGQDAYYITQSASNLIAVVIVIPDREESFRFISSVPGGMTVEEYEEALIKAVIRE